jgi:hypothetical protein
MKSSTSSSTALALPQATPGVRRPRSWLAGALSLRALAVVCGTLLGGVVLPGCGGGGGGGGGGSSGQPVGAIVQNPATDLYFVVSDHQGGDTTSFRIDDVLWGRLVDVYDETSTEPVMRDFVIGVDIVSNGFDYELTLDPLSERESLRILHPIGTPEFASALGIAELNLQVLQKKGISPSELPPFTAVPRNATMVVLFNDLIEDGGNPVPGSSYPGTVNASTVELLTGYAPTVGYDARILPDPNHGDLINGTFHSTRVLIDLTVSEAEALSTNLPVNSLGLPEALNANQPNAVLRFATKTEPLNQQFQVLTSLGGRPLALNGNGPNDPTTATLDIVRGFRSGGKTQVTGDPNNGFMNDENAPLIVGSQPVNVLQTGVLGGPDGNEFDLIVQFQTAVCATVPVAGDILEFPNHRLQVIQDFQGLPAGGIVGPFRVRVVCVGCVPSTPPVASAGEYRTTFRGLAPTDPPERAACFVRISPVPLALPHSGLPTNATITVTFSEPVDPASVQALDTFKLSYDNNVPVATTIYRDVVAAVVPSQDLRRYSFQPTLPLRKMQPGGQADTYLLQVLGGVNGISDLAGNRLEFGIPATTLVMSTAGANVDSGSVSLKFNSNDEDGDTFPEIRGQVQFDTTRFLVRPRPVTRFSQVVDSTVPIVGNMGLFPQPIQTPLSSYGSRMMTLWRYPDLGLSLRDDETHNLDIEQLWWQSFFPTIQVDHFDEFQILLSHSKRQPDESVNSGLLPQYPSSGLVAAFASNVLEPSQTVVHPKARGYTIVQADAAKSGANNTLMPWPINRNIAQSEFTYWTWRDTSRLELGAPDGPGADLQRMQGIGLPAKVGFYPPNKVPTIGLPLLMDFRTYPDGEAVGQNGFQVAIAINSSIQPYFRAFSTGGVNPQNPQDVKQINPDGELTAKGAFNQAPPPTQTPANDPIVYLGQADFLVRVSRFHTIWFDTGAANTLFSTPVFEQQVPNGAQVIPHYRGASAINSSSANSWVNADLYDAYGDGYTSAQLTAINNPNLPSALAFTPTFFPQPPPPAPNPDKNWKGSIGGINGARFFQARISFIANPESGLVPELSAIGVAFRR